MVLGPRHGITAAENSGFKFGPAHWHLREGFLRRGQVSGVAIASQGP